MVGSWVPRARAVFAGVRGEIDVAKFRFCFLFLVSDSSSPIAKMKALLRHCRLPTKVKGGNYSHLSYPALANTRREPGTHSLGMETRISLEREVSHSSFLSPWFLGLTYSVVKIDFQIG